MSGICSGNRVQFDCSYTGTVNVPLWKIGGTLYPINKLPSRHSYRNGVLTVENVKQSDDNETYQCTFLDGLESMIATLSISCKGWILNLGTKLQALCLATSGNSEPLCDGTSCTTEPPQETPGKATISNWYVVSLLSRLSVPPTCVLFHYINCV